MGHKNFIVKDVQADGNCFWRALYRAARRTCHLNRILRRFGHSSHAATPITEESFVILARKAVADYVLHAGSAKVRAMYENLAGIRKESKITYTVMLESFPDWFAHRFRRLPKTFDSFQSKLAKCIARSGHWVSEIDIRLTQDILQRIPLKIINTLPKNNIDSNTIYLLNVGEYHYKYLRATQSTCG